MNTGNISKGMAVIVAASVLLLLVSTVLVAGIDSFNEPNVDTLEQTETETDVITTGLEATVQTVDDETDEVTVELSDDDSSDTVAVPLGETETAVLDSGDVDVTTEEIIDGTTAQMTYEYDTDFGWSEGASSLFNILDLVVVLAVLLLLVGWILTVWT